jgi:hypothetical protein
MAWLLGNSERLSSNDTPDVVFAHIMAPHPPFLLKADCSLRNDVDRPSKSFLTTPDELDERAARYEEQVACLDDFMIDFSSRVAPDSVVIFLSDHGTDRRNQVPVPADQWGPEELGERMQILLAVRQPGNCEIGDEMVSPNLLARVLNCRTEHPDPSELDDEQESRMFLYSRGGDQGNVIAEVPSDTVQSLLRSGASTR